MNMYVMYCMYQVPTNTDVAVEIDFLPLIRLIVVHVCIMYIYDFIYRALSDFDGVFFGTKSINRDNFRTNPNPSL